MATLLWPLPILVLLAMAETVLLGLHIVENATTSDPPKRICTFITAAMDLNMAYFQLMLGVTMAVAAGDAAYADAINWDVLMASSCLVLISIIGWVYAGLASRNGLQRPPPLTAEAQCSARHSSADALAVSTCADTVSS